jgi:hypothetical protein
MAADQGIADGGWIYAESPWGKVRCMARYSEAVEPGTVWTWNALGKAAGAWNLGPNASESQRGFLLNHVITDELPSSPNATTPGHAATRVSNSDPITGQAGWYDVRVRIYPAEADATTSLPQFTAMQPLPGSVSVARRVQAYFAGTGKFAARLRHVVKAPTGNDTVDK